jgi:Pyrimidine dimer DNA glycosylase
MRIWDVPPERLCRQHLLGEHRELHGLWNILTVHEGKGGYAQHPETLRWVGKTRALFQRHQALVREMEGRGYHHRSPLDRRDARGISSQSVLLAEIDDQMAILRNKDCACPLL